MATIELIGDFSQAVTTTETEVADTRSIVQRLLSTIILDNGDIFSPERWIIALTAGSFSRFLVVPDDPTQAARYSTILPDGSEVAYSLSIGDGPVADLSTIILTNQLVISPNALATLLATYTPLSTYTPAIAALQAADSNLQTNINQEVDDREQADNTLTTALTAKENSLGNPGTNGHVLSSTTGGVRSWIAPGGGGGGSTIVYGAWVDATLINSWTGLATIKPGYRLVTIDGVNRYVELRGEATLAPPGSSVMFVLPVGYRPTWRQIPAAGSNGGASVIIIGTDGTVLLFNGGTAPVELSNVRILLV